jgi:hypothetical protein
MSGNHRADQTGKARNVVAGALTAGALLLAPAGVAVFAAPGIANAAGPGGGGPGNPGGPGAPGGGTTTPPTKKIIRLPGLKIEIKNTVGDHKPPTIKFVPFPGLHLPH